MSWATIDESPHDREPTRGEIPVQRQAVRDAKKWLIDQECLDILPGLQECLLEQWGRTRVYVMKKGINPCNDPDPDGNGGRARRPQLFGEPNSLEICEQVLSDPVRLRAVLLHELSHLCGCGELECEVIENLCGGKGATPPNEKDWAVDIPDDWLFHDDWTRDFTLVHVYDRRRGRYGWKNLTPVPGLWAGRFIIRNCVDGRVFVRLPDPPGGAGQELFPKNGDFKPKIPLLKCPTPPGDGRD